MVAVYRGPSAQHVIEIVRRALFHRERHLLEYLITSIPKAGFYFFFYLGSKNVPWEINKPKWISLLKQTIMLQLHTANWLFCIQKKIFEHGDFQINV